MKIDGLDLAIATLQDRSITNELDYQFVMDCLKTYKSPRAKLTRLLQSKALIRVRKGLYLWGPRFQRGPCCLELLANMIYGPSYVSLEKALQIYGLIPEHVELITSVTFKPKREFKTPVGNFSYTYCHFKSYPIGITTRPHSQYENPLIATPEKALTDMLILRRGKVTSLQQIAEILLEDLRIEEEDIRQLDLKLIRKIQKTAPHSAVYFLEKWLVRK